MPKTIEEEYGPPGLLRLDGGPGLCRETAVRAFVFPVGSERDLYFRVIEPKHSYCRGRAMITTFTSSTTKHREYSRKLRETRLILFLYLAVLAELDVVVRSCARYVQVMGYGAMAALIGLCLACTFGGAAMWMRAQRELEREAKNCSCMEDEPTVLSQDEALYTIWLSELPLAGRVMQSWRDRSVTVVCENDSECRNTEMVGITAPTTQR